MLIERGGIRRLIKDSDYPKWAAKGFKKVAEVENPVPKLKRQQKGE